MRFNIVLASAFAALASAQSSSVSASSTVTATSTQPDTPVQSCVKSCAAGDVNCQAACLGTPYPGAVQVNQTTDCVANCDQGDGSVAGNNAYRQCRDRCISSFILTSSLGTSAEATATAGGGFLNAPSVSATPKVVTEDDPSATVSAKTSTGSVSATPKVVTEDDPSRTVSSTPADATDSSSSSTSTSSAGAYSHVQAGSTVGGLAGLIMAVLAM